MILFIFRSGFHTDQDGPGNRLVWHLQGCNLHCPWCTNPEGGAVGGVLLCSGTPAADTCPRGATTAGKLDRDQCASCHERPCLHEARGRGLSWSSVECSVDEMMAEAERAPARFLARMAG